jgi:hypothetical protein
MMKRFIIIGLAFVFLLSVMHITIATHFCGGQVAAVKISLSGKRASCGMESDESSAPFREAWISTRCCYDELDVYKIESHYTPSVFGSELLTLNTIHPVIIPQDVLPNIFIPSQTAHTDCGPPKPFTISVVNLAEICVFRI